MRDAGVAARIEDRLVAVVPLDPIMLMARCRQDLEDLADYVFVESGSLDIADRLIESISQRFLLL